MDLDSLFTNETHPSIRPRFLITYALLEARARNLNQEESIDLIEKMLCQFMDKYNYSINSETDNYALFFSHI